MSIFFYNDPFDFPNDPCDDECRRANHCHGFVECERCGNRRCRLCVDERGLCDKCADEADEEEAREEEDEMEDCGEGAAS